MIYFYSEIYLHR